MSKEEGNDLSRREILGGLTTGAAMSGAAGLASAAETPDREKQLSEAERERLREPYSDPKEARSTFLSLVEPVLEELAQRSIISTSDPSDLRMDRVVLSNTTDVARDALRVRTAWNPASNKGVVTIDTTIPTSDGAVLLSANPRADEAFAFLFTADGPKTVLTTIDDSGISSYAASEGEVQCGDVCDDCCGALDCSAEVEVTVIIAGTEAATGCGCAEGGGLPSPFCCENASCNGTIPCSC